jgi:hypothetical protein
LAKNWIRFWCVKIEWRKSVARLQKFKYWFDSWVSTFYSERAKNQRREHYLPSRLPGLDGATERLEVERTKRGSKDATSPYKKDPAQNSHRKTRLFQSRPSFTRNFKETTKLSLLIQYHPFIEYSSIFVIVLTGITLDPSMTGLSPVTVYLWTQNSI